MLYILRFLFLYDGKWNEIWKSLEQWDIITKLIKKKKVIKLLLSRFKENGIHVRIINEAYTSKSSFYDNDPIKKYMYSGVRIKRGLYQTKEKMMVNADINAALNIYKKYIMKSNSTDNKIDYLMSRGLTIPSRVIVAL